MNDHRDMEKKLGSFKHHPDPGVRQSVMDRFDQAFQPAGPPVRRGFFWSRPIPLYLATAAVLVAVGLSFFAGRQLTRAGAPADSFSGGVVDSTGTMPEEVLWQAAPSDIL